MSDATHLSDEQLAELREIIGADLRRLERGGLLGVTLIFRPATP